MNNDTHDADGQPWAVNTEDAGQTRAMARSLGVSEERLRQAVAAVGASTAAVREYLRRYEDVRLSTTGAVLGRPDREHGAYGMVTGTSDGAAPSNEERAVRGLGPADPSPDGR